MVSFVADFGNDQEEENDAIDKKVNETIVKSKVIKAVNDFNVEGYVSDDDIYLTIVKDYSIVSVNVWFNFKT